MMGLPRVEGPNQLSLHCTSTSGRVLRAASQIFLNRTASKMIQVYSLKKAILARYSNNVCCHQSLSVSSRKAAAALRLYRLIAQANRRRHDAGDPDWLGLAYRPRATPNRGAQWHRGE